MIEIVFEIGKNFVTTKKEQPTEVLLKEVRKLIDSAKDCGAKIVKFQVHSVEDEIHPNINITSPHFDQDRYTWVKRNSYNAEFWWAVKAYCQAVGVEFLATPMSRGAAELLNEEVGVERWKIGSGDILDFPMLDYIRDTGRPIILSSGMSTLEELRMSYEYLKEKTDDITILHCVSQYPCPRERLNLNTIPFLKKEFPEARIGFSDHSNDPISAPIAVALGAEIVEKHFTLDKNAWGPDHITSIDSEQMKWMVDKINRTSENKFKPYKFEVILGKEGKFINGVEETFRPIFRKGLYAAYDIKKNQMFESEMLMSLRPQDVNAEPSWKYPEFLGTFADRDFKKYEAIT